MAADEFVKSGFTKEASQLIKPFRVKESPIQLECKVKEVKSLGENGGAGNLVICEVLLIHVKNEVMNLDKTSIDQNKLDLVARLDLEKNQINAMLNSISDPAIAYSKDFEVILVNPALETITGLSKQDLIGKILSPELISDSRYQVLIPIVFPSLAPTIIEQSLDNYPQRTKIKLFEPQEMVLDIITTKVIDERGKLYGFLKIVHNLTREEELKKTQSDFITVAAHQLRTPLSGLSWLLQTLSDETKDILNSTQKQILDNAQKALQESIKQSVRWLAEWCVRRIKIVHAKVIRKHH